MEQGSVFSIAANLAQVWKSQSLGLVGNANIKILKMGGEGIPPEVHEDFDEMLIVLEGELPLIVEDKSLHLLTGDYCLVPKGHQHYVPAGSFGTLLLIDIYAS
ncbi:MAG: cupin domain-containing protein [Rouxiella aceris]|uniref:cupin domain-containing protein n=1 Tax=Rouxiella aceris TaxID=2703884 RepID=UPI0028471DF1|nr:cupin domain-containing protein [Rouxiella aceris]MDR3432142.1 cupin domain-containing protein [Rouxiella aceris]